MYFHIMIGTGSYTTSTTNMYNNIDFTYLGCSWYCADTVAAVLPSWDADKDRRLCRTLSAVAAAGAGGL